MAMSFDEWADLWFRVQVMRGMHPSVVLLQLENFKLNLERRNLDASIPPRIVSRSDQYIIAEIKTDQLAIFCRRCNQTSFNSNDVQQLYCSHCKQFHNS